LILEVHLSGVTFIFGIDEEAVKFVIDILNLKNSKKQDEMTKLIIS